MTCRLICPQKSSFVLLCSETKTSEYINIWETFKRGVGVKKEVGKRGGERGREQIRIE